MHDLRYPWRWIGVRIPTNSGVRQRCQVNIKLGLPYWKKSWAALLVAACLTVVLKPSEAQERLVLVTPPNTVDTVISEVITRKAYKRIGIDVEILKVPGERALRMANSGKADGEVQRIDGISANYHNLI